MNQPTWKLTTRTPLQDVDVVWRKWPDGRQESCLVTAEEYQRWLAEGNTPLAADAMTPQENGDTFTLSV